MISKKQHYMFTNLKCKEFVPNHSSVSLIERGLSSRPIFCIPGDFSRPKILNWKARSPMNETHGFYRHYVNYKVTFSF